MAKRKHERTDRPARIDIYNEGWRLNFAEKSLEKADISEHNRKLIKDFLNEGRAGRLGTQRITKYTYTLARLAGWLGKDFDTASKQDLQAVISKVEASDRSAWTKRDYRLMLKTFYKFLKSPDGEEYPPEVKWIKGSIKESQRLLPENLVNESDINALIGAAKNARDKALIASLYESGARIGELLSVRLKNLEFDAHGCVLTLPSGKTGARRLRLVMCAGYLDAWLKIHPARENPDAPLWAMLERREKNGSGALGYAAASKVLRILAKEAKIKKRVNPHGFRHSRASFLAKKLTEAQLKEYLGWTQSSNMASVYVHLSGRDLDNAILGLNGIVSEKAQEESKLTAQRCPLCGYLNTPDAEYCQHEQDGFRCGTILDIAKYKLAQQNKDETFKKIAEQQQKQIDYLLRRLEEIDKPKIH